VYGTIATKDEEKSSPRCSAEMFKNAAAVHNNKRPLKFYILTILLS
jgi:hypothetical protein